MMGSKQRGEVSRFVVQITHYSGWFGPKTCCSSSLTLTFSLSTSLTPSAALSLALVQSRTKELTHFSQASLKPRLAGHVTWDLHHQHPDQKHLFNFLLLFLFSCGRLHNSSNCFHFSLQKSW